VQQSREVIVNVVSCKQVEKSGVAQHLVHSWVPEQVTVQQAYCEMVPYQYTVRVPVPVPVPYCAPPGPPPCAH
jgi:hypothetical protein